MQEKQQSFYTKFDWADAEKKKIDEAKTTSEHEAIILKYQKTGVLDRDDAIKKYKDFNSAHPEYYASMTVAATASGSSVPIDNVSDNVIVGNLQAQLAYLTGKR